MAHRHQHHTRPLQEEDTLPPRLILYAIIGSLTLSIVLSFISVSIERVREHDLRPSDQFPEEHLGPIVERSGVHEELFSNVGRGQILALQGRQRLGIFEWVDDQKKIVRVPIDVAMDLFVEQANKQPAP